jgi:hypothetical protein
MEIEDFKPKQPADTPQLVKDVSAEEDATAVKDEVTVEEEPVLTLEGKTISPSELAESLVELKDRAKAAGMRPIQNMVISYINQGLSMVDGLLESLEGSKKKDK